MGQILGLQCEARWDSKLGQMDYKVGQAGNTECGKDYKVGQYIPYHDSIDLKVFDS